MIDAGKCFVRSLARSNASIAEMLNDDAVLEECNAGGNPGGVPTNEQGWLAVAWPPRFD